MPLPHKNFNLALLTLLLFLGIPTLRESQPDFFNFSAIAQTVEELKEEASRLWNLGLEQYNRSQFQNVLQSWEQALEIYRQLGDKAGEGRTLNNLGTVYNSLGEVDLILN